MLRKIFIAVAIVAGTAQPLLAADDVDPQADFKAFRKYFTERFPKVPLNDFVNGPYSMDAGLRKQWKANDEFPPYEFAVEQGKQMFATPFKNGKTYADCFPNKGIGVRQMYPMFDAKSGKVITLEVAVNQCREANGEKPLDYIKDDMASLTAYMAFTSRGKPFDIKIPNDPRALAAYKNGEEYFYTRRGQLNFSCASCHVQSPGKRIRTEVLAPALGIIAALPIYRSEWGGMGTTSRRLPPATARCAAFRSSRRPTKTIATSNTSCRTWPTACRSPGRARVREQNRWRKQFACAPCFDPCGGPPFGGCLGNFGAGRIGGRFQGSSGESRGREQAGRRAQEPVDHNGPGHRRGEEGRRCRQVRRGRRPCAASRGLGQRLDRAGQGAGKALGRRRYPLSRRPSLRRLLRCVAATC